MPRKLLIIEDDEALSEVLSDYLLEKGFEVHRASDREEAETLLFHFQYSLVITDLALSRVGLTGMDVLEVLNGITPRPKTIVLTGQHDPALASEIARLHVDRFLTKPKSLVEIGRTAEELLGPQPQ